MKTLEQKIKTEHFVVTCSICQDYVKLDDQGKRVWYTPTPDERRFAYKDGYRLSRGSCIPCSILQLERDGTYTPEEIKEMVDKYR